MLSYLNNENVSVNRSVNRIKTYDVRAEHDKFMKENPMTQAEAMAKAMEFAKRHRKK